MDDTPFLSVCLITYNHARFIRQAIDGVLMQKINFPIELIIADDFSTDGTRNILNEYKQKHPDLIRLILQEKNVGAARNWFDLLASPAGNYIAYFEGDDYWTDTNKLQKQVDFLESNPDFSVCFTNASSCLETNNSEELPLKTLFPVNRPDEVILQKDLLRENQLITVTTVFRKHYRSLPDWLFYEAKFGDWPLHIINSSYGKIKYSKDITAVYRIHSSGLYSGIKYLTQLENYVSTGKVLLESFSDKSNSGYIKEGQRNRILQILFFAYQEKNVKVYIKYLRIYFTMITSVKDIRAILKPAIKFFFIKVRK